MHPMPELTLMTWRDVEAYLERSRLILIPIGSTEQHGPNGLLGTDRITAEAIARRVGDHIDALVAPTISVGMALHHLAFPGTISLRPETLIAVIRDYVWSLHHTGFRQFLFINGHGGNIATGRAAFSGIREQLADAVLEWRNWWEDSPEIDRLVAEYFGDRHGSHATPSEISMTMAVYPGAVRPIEGPMELESCRPRGIPGSARFREIYPDGRIGSDPSLSDPEPGEALLAAATRRISAVATSLTPEIA